MAYLREHEVHPASPASVVYVENADGAIQVEVCDACDYLTIMCEHRLNTWNPEGTQLTCNLCGADGT